MADMYQCTNCGREFENSASLTGHLIHCKALARDPLLVEREKTHGSYSDTALYAQRIKESFNHKRSMMKPEHIEALDLIATKIARIVSGNAKEKDHWLDIAGYAKLGAEACE